MYIHWYDDGFVNLCLVKHQTARNECPHKLVKAHNEIPPGNAVICKKHLGVKTLPTGLSGMKMNDEFTSAANWNQYL